MERETYYISIAEGGISKMKSANTYSFAIQATDEEIVRLRQYFDEVYHADLKTFVRAHIPFLEYSHDPQNDEYDDRLQKAYRMIYELGDEETRMLIGEMGIIDGL